MRMDFALKQELQQKLIMTPQLRQAIAILQFSAIELGQMIERELAENPVLEIEEQSESRAEEKDTSLSEEAPSLAEQYLDWASYLDGPMEQEYAVADKNKYASFEAVVAASEHLQDHLELQLHFLILDKMRREIGEYLIGCCNDQGYLHVSLEEIAQRFGVQMSIVEEILDLLQSFDPAGVCARNLKECLQIQVRYRGWEEPILMEIIASHLDHLAQGRIPFIAEQLRVSPAKVQQAVDKIRALDPKPGLAYGGSQSLYIVPDMTVERVNEEFVILMNEQDTPRLTINSYYRKLARDGEPEARNFVENRIQSAVWLIKSIEQRRRTLYKIMEALLELQRPFFEQGPKAILPLTMKQVAEQVGVHESTISRATNNKYVETPHGIFHMRAFFSTSLPNDKGNDVSASRIKQELRDLIAGEDTSAPYSDQMLADAFAAKGIKLSRRTVTKYREELGISSSTRRKHY